MHYHNSTATFLLFIILFWIIGKNLHLVHCQLQNFVFTFFFGWLCHFQRWVFFWKTLTQKKFHSIDIFFNFCKCSKDVKASIWWWPFTFLTSEVQFWIKSTAFLFFIYFLILFFKIFHHWLWSPNLAAFQFLGTSFPSSPQSQLQPHCLLHLQFWKLCNIPSCLCAKVLFRLFYLKGLKAICRGHALFLTILTARKTNLIQPNLLG